MVILCAAPQARLPGHVNLIEGRYSHDIGDWNKGSSIFVESTGVSTVASGLCEGECSALLSSGSIPMAPRPRRLKVGLLVE